MANTMQAIHQRSATGATRRPRQSAITARNHQATKAAMRGIPRG